MSFQEMEMKTEIEIIEDWKPSDVPASPLFNGQNKLTRSDLNESENPNDDIDISIGSVFTLKVEGIIFSFNINCSNYSIGPLLTLMIIFQTTII